MKGRPLSDLYHRLMRISWPRFFALAVLTILGLNALFALAYEWGGGVEGARPGSFADAFFFSFQTFSTVGFGRLYPSSFFANAMAVCEGIVGILVIALLTGLIFGKFSRPTARVLFSNCAVVAHHDGKPTLMLRMANARGNQIVEAHLHLVLARSEITAEGESVRRFHDLNLERSSTALFTLTWTALHVIDESSPLFGETPETLANSNADVVASLLGIDDTFSATVHARHGYPHTQIRWNHRFADILSVSPGGARVIDYSKFHDTVPEGDPHAPPATASLGDT